MANSLDQPPFYDAITQNPALNISETWSLWFSALIQNLIEFVNENGMYLPQLTADQIKAIQSPVNGQMVYNVSIQSAQYYKNGAWSSF